MVPAQLPLSTRHLLAAILAVAGLSYAALLVATYLQTTASAALGPDLSELDRLLFHAARPISPMERRLEASDTPLGSGPLISGQHTTAGPLRVLVGRPSMRTKQSAEWIELTQGMNDEELAALIAEREGERQALLDWIRLGASRVAYERDDHVVTNPAVVATMTPAFLCSEGRQPATTNLPHVRIRSLVNERCVGCHCDDGDDTARLIPFDSYEGIARWLIPDAHERAARPWLMVALALLFPLAALASSAFAWMSHPRTLRLAVWSATLASLLIVAACWLGGGFVPLLLAAAAVALVCTYLQLLASLVELLGGVAGLPSRALLWRRMAHTAAAP